MASRSDQPPADERTYDSGSFDAELFWHRHRTAILLGGAVILAIAAAVAIWFFSQLSARRAAEALFAEARDDAAWRAAHLEVSKVDRRLGMPTSFSQIRCARKGSSTSLRRFIRNFFPCFRPVLWPEARGLGLPRTLPQLGRPRRRWMRCARCRQKIPPATLRRSLRFWKAAPWFEMGKLEEARKVFANLVATYPQSPPGRAAGAQLDALAPFLAPDVEKTAQ